MREQMISWLYLCLALIFGGGILLGVKEFAKPFDTQVLGWSAIIIGSSAGFLLLMCVLISG